MLIDQYQRRIRKVRVSLTDKCNLRCHYCMPLTQTFMDESRYLSVSELTTVLRELHSLGVEEIRFTGGEPLLRKSFREIIAEASLIGFMKLSITTNGILLDRYFDDLIRYQVLHLNVSLDSLDPLNFSKITKGSYHEKILANILRSRDLGFQVKLNAVIMRGLNDHELEGFVDFAETESIEIRFLELMKIGHARGEQEKLFVSADEMLSRLPNLRQIQAPIDSTSLNYLTKKGGKIGIIASETKPFCGQCSRWRLSADGVLRACLLKEDGVSLRTNDRQNLYSSLLDKKPMNRPLEVAHSMNMIGG